jgi:hypothetical protein
VAFVVDKMPLWQVFSKYFGFSCQFLFHQILHNILSSGAGKIGQLEADVPSGLGLTSPHEIKKILLQLLPAQDVPSTHVYANISGCR